MEKEHLTWGDLFIFLILMVVVLFVAASGGCAHIPQTTPPPPPITHPIDALQKALAQIDSLNTLVYGLSVACIGIGVVLMFYLKTSLGPALIAGGAVTLALSLVVKSLIWFVPWIAGGLVVIGGIAFAMDVRKRGFKNALLDVRELIHAAPAN